MLPKPFTLLTFLFILTFSINLFAGDEVWKPVTPEELALKTPSVEKDADAEAIFWEVKIDDSSREGLNLNHYLRVKIFNERGRDRFSKVEIPFSKSRKIKDLQARVIKPDGTIVPIAQSEIFQKLVARDNDTKIQTLTFAVSNMEIGSILEYRYREFIKGGGANGLRLDFQNNFPIQSIAYYMKPFANGRALNYSSFNMGNVEFVKDKDGFSVARLNNAPAFKREPRMPPEYQVKKWMLLYYSGNDMDLSVGYGAFMGEIAKKASKTKEVKTALEEAVAGATNEEDKLRKIYEFCQTKIRNLNYDTTLTAEQREDIIDDNNKLTDVIKNRIGTSLGIDIAFAHLTNLAGLETRFVIGSDRSEFFLQENSPFSRFFVERVPLAVAVNVSGKWFYCKPGNRFLPFNTLPWYYEDVPAKLAGSDVTSSVITPMKPPQDNKEKRSGKFTINEEGTLEGDLRVEIFGHQAVRQKLLNYDESKETREKDLIEAIRSSIKNAEVTNIVIDDFINSTKPFSYSLHIKVPNYGQKTGKRLIVQPGVFTFGDEPLFKTSDRTHNIYFSYPWSEDDDIEIQFPANYTIESATSPGIFSDPNKIGMLDIKIEPSKEQNSLKYNRRFYFGGEGKVLFGMGVYQPLKNLFDGFYQNSNQTITLKQKQ